MGRYQARKGCRLPGSAWLAIREGWCEGGGWQLWLWLGLEFGFGLCRSALSTEQAGGWVQVGLGGPVGQWLVCVVGRLAVGKNFFLKIKLATCISRTF
jgi:hypothetical protein